MFAVLGSPFNLAQISYPSDPGMTRSRRMTSGRERLCKSLSFGTVFGDFRDVASRCQVLLRKNLQSRIIVDDQNFGSCRHYIFPTRSLHEALSKNQPDSIIGKIICDVAKLPRNIISFNFTTCK